MKILSATVLWMQGYANDPRLEVTVDEIPSLDIMRFEKRKTLYYAEHEGYVAFFAWDGRPGRGYGGQRFPITMTDGTPVTLRGPWSASPSAMHSVGFGPCVDVVLKTPDGYKWGSAGHMTLKLAEIAAKMAGVYMVPTGDKNAERFSPELNAGQVLAIAGVTGLRWIPSITPHWPEKLIIPYHCDKCGADCSDNPGAISTGKHFVNRGLTQWGTPQFVPCEGRVVKVEKEK